MFLYPEPLVAVYIKFVRMCAIFIRIWPTLYYTARLTIHFWINLSSSLRPFALFSCVEPMGYNVGDVLIKFGKPMGFQPRTSVIENSDNTNFSTISHIIPVGWCLAVLSWIMFYYSVLTCYLYQNSSITKMIFHVVWAAFKSNVHF